MKLTLYIGRNVLLVTNIGKQTVVWNSERFFSSHLIVTKPPSASMSASAVLSPMPMPSVCDLCVCPFYAKANVLKLLLLSFY